MSNRRRKARWLRSVSRRAVTAPSFLVEKPETPASNNRVWVPDLDSAHLFDAARGLSSIALPLHPPAQLPPCQNHSQAGRRVRC